MNTKRLSKVSISWSDEFAYALGLIATDGNLSSDGRHISFTTKDLELANTFRQCLSLENKIGMKSRGRELTKKYFVVQFGDKNFYEFLLSIGLRQAKSKTLGRLKIPERVFCHFLRGCIDGDGNISVVYHPESRHPQLRVRLFAFNLTFLRWVHCQVKRQAKVTGGFIYTDTDGRINALTFCKGDSTKLLRYIYCQPKRSPLLTRKYVVAVPFLGE